MLTVSNAAQGELCHFSTHPSSSAPGRWHWGEHWGLPPVCNGRCSHPLHPGRSSAHWPPLQTDWEHHHQPVATRISTPPGHAQGRQIPCLCISVPFFSSSTICTWRWHVLQFPFLLPVPQAWHCTQSLMLSHTAWKPWAEADGDQPWGKHHTQSRLQRCHPQYCSTHVR